MENVYIEKPMGYHIRNGGNDLHDDVWKNHDQRKKIFEYCPELSLIMDMKLERERCDGDDREGTIHPTEEERKKKEEEARKKKQAEEAIKKAEEEKKKQAEEAIRKAE